MPSNITDVDAFTADVTVPSGADARTASSVITPIQALSNRCRYLYNRLIRLDGLYEDDVMRIPSTGAAQAQNGGWSEQGLGSWRSESGDSGLYIPLDAANFPHGCTITGYTVTVNPGAARAGLNRMYAQILSKDADGVQTVESSETYDNTTTYQQTITVIDLAIVVDRAVSEYYIHVRSGSDGGTNKDAFLACSVTRTL